ncbi:MAG: transglutaminase family protein [Candidatus Marinimicrobia bacterium]|nr:transglutaminase family protein [Candidatus Neomarinimicrobiota bacterium]
MEAVLKPDGRKRKRYTWEYADLPPIRKEPHITTIKDYMTSLNFQLIGYSDGIARFSFVQTWEDLKEKIEPTYKPYLKGNRKIRKLVSELTGSITAEADIVETLFHFVRDSIETSRYRGYWGNGIRGPGALLSSGHGSRVEKNLLLVSLLRTAGLNAEPLLISTRANGRLDTRNPRADSFNHLLVFMGRPAKFRLLDASDPFCPITLLPANYLTNTGWLILTGDSDGLVTIPAPNSLSAKFATIDSARIDSTGNLEGQITIRYEGYRGIRYRRLLAESKTERKFIEEEVFDIFNNAEIDTFQVLRAEKKESPLVVIARFRIPGFAEVAGDKIYFSPALFQRFQENQFRLEKRTYPVEYNFPSMDQEMITFELPANYAIIEAPQNIDWKIRGQEFRRLLTRNADGRLNYYRNLHIAKVYYSPVEYEMLKNFTTYIVEADGDQLVLQRQSN